MALWKSRALTLTILLAAVPVAAADKDKDAKKKPHAAATPDAVAVVDGETITAAQLDERANKELAQLRAQEYQIRERALDEAIADRLIQKEAKARGLSSTEYLRVEIDAKVAPVTEDDKKAFYEKVKARAGNTPEAELMRQIEEHLRKQRTDERKAALLTELRAKSQVRVLLEPPRRAVEAVGPAKGPATAPVTIVEFSDFQCPYCSRVNDTIEHVLERYGTQVRLVFRHFPLPMHANAPKAAEAGSCAGEQGKFWEMHDKMFANQNALDAEGLKKAAGALGLDAARFGECLDSGKFSAEVKKSVDDGQANGVSGTPAFFINGRFINGAQPLEAFTKVIDDELSRKGLPIPAPKPASQATS